MNCLYFASNKCNLNTFSTILVHILSIKTFDYRKNNLDRWFQTSTKDHC